MLTTCHVPYLQMTIKSLLLGMLASSGDLELDVGDSAIFAITSKQETRNSDLVRTQLMLSINKDLVTIEQ